jgi:ubiquinone biosynthesis protein COQ9
MIQPPQRLPDRDNAIEAMLPHVPCYGWTHRALKAGLHDAGNPADEADLLFPLGTVDMIATFFDLADRRLEQAAGTLPRMRLGEIVRAVIKLRLEQNRPHKEAIRRAIGVLSLPRNARVAAACAARTVDSIWHAAGDRSADFAWYTKRAQLAAIYGATILYWLRDMSSDDSDTLAFLDSRLADSARIGQIRKRFDAAVARLPLLRRQVL